MEVYDEWYFLKLNAADWVLSGKLLYYDVATVRKSFE